MKTKKQNSKKVLSVFLAVLMIMSAWVFVAPAETEAVSAATISSTNTSAVSKYADSNFNTGFTTVSGNFHGDNASTMASRGYYKNVLYSPHFPASNNNLNNSDAGVYFGNLGGTADGARVWYPNTTLIWDGVTTPQIPILFDIDSNNNNRVGVKNVYISSGANGLAFRDSYWTAKSECGKDTNYYTHFTFDWIMRNNSGNHWISTSSGNDKESMCSTKGYWDIYGTYLQYTGGSFGSGSTYYKAITPTWVCRTGSNYAGTTNKTIYVIDYVPLKNALNDVKTLINEVKNNPAKYTTTSVSALVDAADKLIAAKPNNFINSSLNDVYGWNSAVSAALSAYNSAKNLVVQQYTLTFKSVNGTTKTYTYNYGTSVNLNSLAANHANTIKQIDADKHQLYTWNTGAGTITLTGDYTVSETTDKSEGHNYDKNGDGTTNKDDVTKITDNAHEWTCSVCDYVKTQDHVKDDGTITKADTCTEAGVKTYNCSICGKEAIETETVDKISGHDFTGDWVIREEGENGTHWRRCNLCGAYGFGGVENDYENHNWDKNNDGVVNSSDATSKTPSTCKDAGSETYTCKACPATFTKTLELVAHQTVKTDAKDVANICGGDGNVAFWTCSVCNRVWKDEALTDEVTDLTDADGDNIPDGLETKGPDHEFTGACVSVSGGADGKHYRQCKRFTQCKTYGPEEAHKYGEPAVTDPTCTATGKKVYTCADCKQTYTVTLNKVAHTITKIEAVAPECGKAGNNEYYYCSGCSKYYKDADGTTETTVANETIAALKHTWTGPHDYDKIKTPATCMAAAVYYKHCDYCKAQVTGTYSYGDVDKVNGHNFNGEIKKNTDGTHSYKCTVADCPDYGNATTCTYEVTEDVASTCKTAGHTTYTCTTCGNGYSEIKAINSSNHTGEGTYIIADQAATCATLGSTGIEMCSGCDVALSTKLNDLPVDPTNHENMKDYEGLAATCQTAGYKAYKYCDKCGAYEVEKVTIEKKDHKFTTYTSNGDGTHTATCDTCKAEAGEIATETKNCAGGTANCVDKAVCTVCNAAYGNVDSAKHKTVITVAEVDSTCQTEGTEAYKYCEACNTDIDVKTPIAKKAHIYDAWSKIDGENKHIRSCKTCKSDVAAVATETADCNGGVAYCNALAVCADCKAEYGAFDAANHKSEAWTLKNAKEATCTAKGYTGDKLYNCCDTLKEAGEAIDELAHSFVEVSREKSTCIKAGSVTYECSTCPADNRETKTEPLGIDAKNHASTETIVVGKVDVTCIEDGHTGKTYYVCCYDSTKTEAENKKALASEGSVIKANGKHSYTAVVPEYMIAEIAESKDENGKTVKEIVLKKEEPSYEEKIAMRHENDDNWYHVQMCTTCYEIKNTACATLEIKANCVETNICSECNGLCSLRSSNKHGGITKIEKISATCTTAGRKEYYKCTACNKEYFDSSAKNEITAENRDTLVIKATGNHTLDRSQTPEAIMDEAGKLTGVHAYKCSFTYTDAEGKIVTCNEIITEACSGGKADCQNAAVCEYCGTGYGEVDVNNHAGKTQVKDTVLPDKCKPGSSGKTVYTCCGAVAFEGTELPAIEGHDWTERTEGLVDNCAQGYTIYRKCNYCGYEDDPTYVEGVGHKVTRVVYETEKDCTTARSIYYACAICSYTDKIIEIDGVTYGYLDVTTIPAAGKCNFTKWNYEATASCIQEGKKTRECTVCGKVETVILPKTDHVLLVEEGYAATCKSEGKQNYAYCVVEGCPYVKGGAILDKNQAGAKIAPYKHNEDTNGDKYCDYCGEYTQVNIDGTNCNCVCHKQNGLMKLIYGMLRFFWKLFGINKTCCSAGVHY